jgi:DNA-binding transcriptional ArsR family regulator
MVVWRTALADGGVTVETVDAEHVRLRTRHGDVVVRQRRLSALTPSRVPASPDGPGLLVAPAATLRSVRAALAAGWNVATDAGEFAVRVGGHTMTPQRRETARPARHPGPPSWSLLTITRRLLAGVPATGQDLARLSGVSQSRTSRALSRLADQGLVERGSDGYRPTNWRRLLTWWLANYPGPGGTASYWASAHDQRTQTQATLDALQSTGRVAVSGDPAADVLAPWRIPSLAVVYAEHGVPLRDIGFVPVGSAAEATLVLCAPADPGIWLPTTWTVQGIPLADPIQIIHDVGNGTEPDRPEAADHLIESLRSHHLQAWRAAIR